MEKTMSDKITEAIDRCRDTRRTTIAWLVGFAGAAVLGLAAFLWNMQGTLFYIKGQTDLIVQQQSKPPNVTVAHDTDVANKNQK